MNAPTHLLGGATVGMMVVQITQNNLIHSGWHQLLFDAVVIGTSVIASDFPDLDKKNTYISHKFKALSWFIRKFTGHRGFMHTLLAEILLLALISYLKVFTDNLTLISLDNAVCLGFVLGYSMHLFLDIITSAGVMLLYPFDKTKYSIANLNGNRDRFKVDLPLICIFVYAIYNFIA